MAVGLLTTMTFSSGHPQRELSDAFRQGLRTLGYLPSPRLALLIRRLLTTQRDPDGWPTAKDELRGWTFRQTVIAALAVLALANGCATCSSDDLTNRASWGAPVAVVDQAGFVYRGDVFPSAPWGIPSVRTWGVPCRLPESVRNTARPCTPAEMADPNGPVCYIWRYVP